MLMTQREQDGLNEWGLANKDALFLGRLEDILSQLAFEESLVIPLFPSVRGTFVCVKNTGNPTIPYATVLVCAAERPVITCQLSSCIGPGFPEAVARRMLEEFVSKLLLTNKPLTLHGLFADPSFVFSRGESKRITYNDVHVDSFERLCAILILDPKEDAPKRGFFHLVKETFCRLTTTARARHDYSPTLTSASPEGFLLSGRLQKNTNTTPLGFVGKDGTLISFIDSAGSTSRFEEAIAQFDVANVALPTKWMTLPDKRYVALVTQYAQLHAARLQLLDQLQSLSKLAALALNNWSSLAARGEKGLDLGLTELQEIFADKQLRATIPPSTTPTVFLTWTERGIKWTDKILETTFDLQCYLSVSFPSEGDASYAGYCTPLVEVLPADTPTHCHPNAYNRTKQCFGTADKVLQTAASARDLVQMVIIASASFRTYTMDALHVHLKPWCAMWNIRTHPYTKPGAKEKE